MDKAARHVSYRQYRPSSWEQVESGVIVEKPVSLTVNGELWLTFMCTPVDLEALAIGFLFNENLIQTMDDVASVRLCPTGDNLDVWLNRSVENPKIWRRTSGCTGGVTSGESDKTLPFNNNGYTIPSKAIGRLVGELFESQQLYKDVGGVHTSALSDGRVIAVTAEDIGRHNTLDKIAGRCLLDGVHLNRSILLTTGRISSEMMQKAARIGASIVISRTSPSSLSIEMARLWGITLIGYARRDRYNVYTHPQRITVTSGSLDPVVISPAGEQLKVSSQ